MKMSKIKWDSENIAVLVKAAGAEGSSVSLDQVAKIAEQFGSAEYAKSVAAKLRHMKYSVEKKASSAPVFSEAETKMLQDFLRANANKYTAVEVAEKFQNSKFTVAQIRGKVLSLELNKAIKPAPKVEAVKAYSDAEEAKILSLWAAGKYVEEIAEVLGKTVNSVRGKCLSMLKTQPEGTSLPAQRDKVAKKDFLDGINVATLTVEEIAEATDRSVTGIKSTLTRRGISSADYDGAARAAKRAAKKAAE